MFVKICGLSTIEATRAALDAGADAIGLVISARSKRNVTIEAAQRIANYVGTNAQKVLVVNDLPAVQAAHLAKEIGADILQLHGGNYDLSEFRDARTIVSRLWRATTEQARGSLPVGSWGEEALLLDAPAPGSGQTWDFSRLKLRPPRGKWILAGGLNPGNVTPAIMSCRPWGVDVSSGVEKAPGVKDVTLIAKFVYAAKNTM
ncbi:phosphoribosylanthranilate isomerase [Diaminobutyricibacter sp. McL0608]|uniref:phosphoribosylanthranilate isomerase n=1 Tax=Leifsonia sp. McL0608 TaxID=3143537 RepID=UPI0031F30CC0